MTLYSLDILFFLFGTSLFHVQFSLLLFGLHTDFLEADQVVWYSHLFKYFLQFVVILTVKGFGIVKKEVDAFWNSLLFR